MISEGIFIMSYKLRLSFIANILKINFYSDISDWAYSRTISNYVAYINLECAYLSANGAYLYMYYGSNPDDDPYASRLYFAMFATSTGTISSIKYRSSINFAGRFG